MMGNEIQDVSSVELTGDALQSSHAVPKSQAETISALAVQAKIVSAAAGAASDTMFSSQFTNAALATKQPNMQIDVSSTQYLEIVDGYKIKLKDLGIITNYKDTAHADLDSFIAAATFNGNNTLTIDGSTLDANTLVFLESASNPAEKAFVYLGTNNGDSSDFVSFSVDYNQSTIRTFFNDGGVGMQYDASTGIFSLVLGNGPQDLGAHTVPMDATKFNTINSATIEHALLALESFIESVDSTATGGQATIDTRLTSLSGVSGNNLQSFIEGLFTDNQSIKTIMQESETLHKAAITDRAAIRAERLAADGVLQSNIDQEEVSRQLADANLSAAINQETANRINYAMLASAERSAEATSRIAGDSALSSRLDIVEGSETVEGSVNKAEQDAKDYADAKVLIEKQRAETAEAVLNSKIDNLAEGDITFIGQVQVDGTVSIRADRIAAGDTRNGQNLKDMVVLAGEEFVVAADQTMVFNDSSSIVLQNGDKMMSLDDVTAGQSVAATFNVVQANGSALSVSNLDDLRIEQKIDGNLDIVADSVGRVQLDSAIEADIDDKQSLTSANTITSDGDTHFVTSSALGAQQNVYWKRTQLGSDPLTGTARTLLGELIVNSSGSGNPLAPSYAHTETKSSHYAGSCLDLSLVMGGGNFEANASASAAIQATGVYASASEPQLGINIGVTGYANGAAVSNVGMVAFSGTAGVGKDRGIVASVSTADIINYSGLRQIDQFPFDDIAGVFDAKYGPAGCKALYTSGDVYFGWGSGDSCKVEVQSAPSTELGVMRLKDVKDKEKIYQMDLTNNVEKVISCGLDLNKSLIQVIDNDEDVEVHVVRDVSSGQLKVTAIGGNLTDARVIVKELECDVETV